MIVIYAGKASIAASYDKFVSKFKLSFKEKKSKSFISLWWRMFIVYIL